MKRLKEEIRKMKLTERRIIAYGIGTAVFILTTISMGFAALLILGDFCAPCKYPIAGIAGGIMGLAITIWISLWVAFRFKEGDKI